MFGRKKSEAEQSHVELFREKLEARIRESKDLKDLTDSMSLMEKLNDLRNKKKFSPDTMLIVGGNLVGILLILEHERFHVIASKAVGFVMRGRV